MVIDDDEIIRNLLQTLLTQKDFDVTLFYSGYSAIKAAKDIQPNIVIVDLTLPDISGLNAIKEIKKVSAQGGRIQMPTGSFDLEELISAFKTMPFDLTFVDKDDTVRYFSPGADRIFDRSRTILGRKVQYCHPPKSVRTVNQIIADFKEGKQDRARFWINLGPRFIYITYYALRSDKGDYLGTLEVTQDLTELRQLL